MIALVRDLRSFTSPEDQNFAVLRGRITDWQRVNAAIRKGLETMPPADARDLLSEAADACRPDGILELRLGSYKPWQGHGIATRMARHLRGYVATARVALEAKQAHGNDDELERAVEAACDVWSKAPVGTSRQPLQQLREPDAVARATRAFGRMDEWGKRVSSALYWTLSWLDLDDAVVSSSIDDHDRSLTWLQIPLLHYNESTGKGGVGYLEIARLISSNRPELVTHPETGLTIVLRNFEETIEEAWQDYGGAAVWRLRMPEGLQHSGESLELAARVGFRALGTDHPYYRSDCVLLGRVKAGGRLEPVGTITEKLRAAAVAGIRAALVAPNDNEPVDRADLERRGMGEVQEATSFERAIRFATGAASGSPVAAGQTYLGRYQLELQLPGNDLWIATQVDGSSEKQRKYLVRLYNYGHAGVDTGFEDFRRTAWARDLRTLNRLTNAPGAEDSLLTLRQAGKDIDNQAYVLVLESASNGMKPLESFLETRRRSLTPWLSRSRSAELWNGLRRVAEGIRVLHTERILHRHISASTVFCDDVGPTSFRLGGIEQSLRVASIDDRPSTPRPNWCLPPESPNDAFDAVDSTGSDWYAFGMLAARVLLAIENLSTRQPVDLQREVEQKLRGQDGQTLTRLEREFILELISRNSGIRLEPVYIRSRIDEIVRAAEAPTSPVAKPLGLFLSKKPEDLAEIGRAAQRFGGFLPEKATPAVEFEPTSRAHKVELRDWVQEDVKRGVLFRYYAKGQEARGPRYAIRGRSGTVLYYLQPWSRDGGVNAWRFGVLRLRNVIGENLREEHCLSLSRLRIKVYLHDVDGAGVKEASHEDWETVLPKEPVLTDEQQKWRTFEHFLRTTNQIELLMLRDEIFEFGSAHHTRTMQGERLVLTEAHRQRQWRRDGRSMSDFFHAEIEAGRGSGLVHVFSGTPFDDCEDDPWEVEFENDRMVLRRTHVGKRPPVKGYVRSTEFQGKISLIERRRDAIERLAGYGYMLRALLDPQLVWMNTGGSIDTAKVFGTSVEAAVAKYHDKPERLQEIIQSFPIYALEGPPGTGKSTLTSFLVRALLLEDPAVQILVTAQAHGALDVLRQRIEDVIDRLEMPGGRRPITVRLGQKSADGTVDQDAQRQTERVHVEQACTAFAARPPTTTASAVWRDIVAIFAQVIGFGAGPNEPKTVVDLGLLSSPQRSLANYGELLRGAANIIYTTTAARDLSYLAQKRPTFDWVIVEEAGKAHGFDLALPMQAGHRWVLLGDSSQLRPYRYDDFKDAIGKMDDVVDQLAALAESGADQVDTTWLTWWDSLDQDEQKRFVEREAPSWLATFEYVSKRLSSLEDDDGRRAGGALETQFRMHPDIGSLISEVFYQGQLRNAPECLDIKHQVQIPGLTPEQALKLRDCAIVWIDLPWSDHRANADFTEDGHIPYSNPKELERIAAMVGALQQAAKRGVPNSLAVLSPYSRQVRQLHDRLSKVSLRAEFEFKQSHARAGSTRPLSRAHTVDSFQGNEADIVMVSLVRNNTKPAPNGLGFITDPFRLNVLASRAAKLLVFVGSWDFFVSQTKDLSVDSIEVMQQFMRVLQQYREDDRLLFVPASAAKRGSR